jgi:hypothetical protein
MGFLEDLVRTIQEAADEARASQRQKSKSSPEWSPPAPEQDQRQRAQIVRRHREKREQQVEEEAKPERHARHSRETPPSQPQRQPPTGTDRLRRLLHQPHTLRELVLLREILDRPVALRGPITRRFPPR